MKYGKALGANIKDIISIVRYDTFLMWLRDNEKGFRIVPYKKRGRRFKAPELRKLVVQMARKNAWGITRILGELRKLRIYQFSRSTIANDRHGNLICLRKSFLRISISLIWGKEIFPNCKYDYKRNYYRENK